MSKGHFFNSRIGLTRNTKGHYWDENGILQTAAVGEPRFNHNPKTGLVEGLTIMGQWTNEIQDPRDMTTGNWVGSATASRNQVGIDGEANTATELSASETFHGKEQTIAVSDDSSTHTARVIFKKEPTKDDKLTIELFLSGGTGVSTMKSLSPSGEGESDNNELIDLGDWWAIELSITNNGTGNTTLGIDIEPDVSDTGQSITVGLVEVFLNRSSPPPVPVYGETAGQSYTQDPDIATVTDLDSINFNPDEHTYIVDVITGGDINDGQIIFEFSGSGDQRIALFRRPGQNMGVRINTADGTTQWDVNQFTLNNNTRYRIGVALKGNDMAVAIDGSIIDSTSSAEMPQEFTELSIGSRPNNTQFWDSFIRELPLYPRRLSNDQLIQETTI